MNPASFNPSQLDGSANNSNSNSVNDVKVYTMNVIADPQMIGSTHEITPEVALSIPAFYSASRFLCETIATLPKWVYQKQQGVKQRREEHSVDWLLNQEINEYTTPFTFWSTFILHAAVWSNAYAYIYRNGSDTKLLNIPPDRVKPLRIDGKQYYFVKVDGQKEPVCLLAEEVMHLPALSYNSQTGIPMVSMMQGSLRIAKSAESFGEKFFSQGGHLGGVIEAETDLTAEQLTEYRNQINQKYAGLDSAHKWMVLGSKAKAKTLTLAPESAQYNETRQFSVVEICRMLRVPPHLVYDLGKATWGNIESLGIEAVKYSLNNWITPLEQEINRKLLTIEERKAGYYIRFNVGALERGDTAQQVETAVKRVMNGITTIDEERALLELPPHEKDMGETPRAPANTVPLAQLETPAETAAEDEGEETEETVEAVEGSTLNKAITIDLFADLITDAAARVETKTQKATENNKKHLSNPTQWNAWYQVFTDQQASYARDVLTPLLATYAKTGGQTPTNAPEVIGKRYSRELKQYFAAMAHGETPPAPKLSQITLEIMGEAHG